MKIQLFDPDFHGKRSRRLDTAERKICWTDCGHDRRSARPQLLADLRAVCGNSRNHRHRPAHFASHRPYSNTAAVLKNGHGHRVLALSFLGRFLMSELHQEQQIVDDLQHAADEQWP
jgi:hypothetical protein